jgi:DNA-binding LytR/AlgR family response regulator
MIKCIIIDDEPDAIHVLKKYIEEVPDLQVVNSTTKPMEILDHLKLHDADLIFLDIEMPLISGINFIKLARQIRPGIQIILTTAYSQYAVQGFDHEVTDYLLKPISIERFLQAIQRIRLLIKQYDPGSDDKDLPGFFFISAGAKGKSVKIRFDEIHYIEGMQRYVAIYTASERVVGILTLQKLEKLLPKHKFRRVHRSYIIPVDQIKSIDGNRIYLHSTHTVIDIGITYREEFMNFLKDNSPA